MEIILIQIENEKAYKILTDLQDLNILKIIRKVETSSIKLSEKYEGKLDSKIVEEIQNYLQSSREEWNKVNF
jgi:predicted house-cleaning noncanonical NTP pyrophosphatase (MazG superfamily)